MTNLVDTAGLMPADFTPERLAAINDVLQPLSPQDRVAWALEHLPSNIILSSSFGIQAAVMLHLVTQQRADIPVLLLDTGYLFPETYRFIDELTERLSLNVQTYQAKQSAAWQEARFGKLWEQGVDGIKRYNDINKVEPMQRAIEDLGANTWFSGLRRQQASSRQDKPVLELSRGVLKVYPIIEWTNKDVHYYLKDNDLPYHPLWDQGYVSVGDHHTSMPLKPGMTEEETRFFGLTRECGLHMDGDGI